MDISKYLQIKMPICTKKMFLKLKSERFIASYGCPYY